MANARALPIKLPVRTNAHFLAQTRYQLMLMGLGAVILALFTLLLATNAYRVSYDLFRGIVVVNSNTVDASERALQYIAQASQSAADYAMLTSDTPLFEQSQNNIFRAFSDFRDEMTRLEANLQTDDERSAFIVAETLTYSRFWRHVSNLITQRTNDDVARREYLEADNHVRSWINPALESLENLNFEQMVQAGDSAEGLIQMQIFLFCIPAVGLAILLTVLSFEVRQKVRRYITPGIDIAVVLSYVTLMLVITNLADMPKQLDTMIQSAYRSVSASSRVLVDANLANRAESSALIDAERIDAWNERFDAAVERIQLRICGQTDCLQASFLSGSDTLRRDTITMGYQISRENSREIAEIIPLVANVTFAGEANALEEARFAFQEYLTANLKLRKMIETGDIESAILFNTSTEAGTSQEAFNRFTSAMNNLSQINRAVFDQIWEAERPRLQSNQLWYGAISYVLIIGLVIFGLWHRVREL